MTQLVSKAVGIDLGTTNSAVAVMNPTDSDVVIHKDPNTRASTTPSCVWSGRAGTEPLIGRKAFARKGGRPEPISSIKRLMGTRSTVELGGEQVSPQQVSALILAEMKRQIETNVADFGEAGSRWIVDRAVVTVPAYFDQPQIDATREAAEAAGLEVLGLLHEPTAAASYHCWRTATRDGTFLVYDLGGGTFDVSILRCTAGAFEVLGISGNNLLGGDDIDAGFARHLQAMLQADGWALDLDPERDEEDRSRFSWLKTLAEGTKKALSGAHEHMLRDSGLLKDKEGNPVAIETLVERAELEAIARPLIERTFLYCDEAIARAQERAGISLSDVDEVILAGGSTHMPLVRELVTRELCGAPSADSARKERAKCAEPVYQEVDTVVALGAAVRASAIGGMVVYDEDRTVRIGLRGTGVTGASRHTVGGTVESLAPEVDLRGGRVALTAGDYEEETDLTAEGTFAFTRVPVQADATTEFAFEVYDAEGVLRAAAGRSLVHSSTADLGVDGGSATSAQNTKRITLEVRSAGAGSVTQFPLVDVLEQLPLARDYTFSHPGGVEKVELRLFQEGRPIQVIGVQVPRTTPKDTPILMHVVMHENYAITVEGSIGQSPYQADVQLPMERGMPGEQEVADLESQFQDDVVVLPAGRRATAQARFTMAHQAFVEARGQGDVARATHERDEMATIVNSIVPADSELRPPKAEFDTLVEKCRQLHAYYQHGDVPEGQTFDATEIGKSIEEHRRGGEQAYTERNQLSYSEAHAKIEAIFTYLFNLGQDRQRPTSSLSTADLASVQLDTVKATAGKLAFRAQNLHDSEAERQLAKVGEQIDRLRPQISVNPQYVLEEGGKLRALLRQIAASLGDGTESSPLPGIPELNK